MGGTFAPDVVGTSVPSSARCKLVMVFAKRLREGEYRRKGNMVDSRTSYRGSPRLGTERATIRKCPVDWGISGEATEGEGKSDGVNGAYWFGEIVWLLGCKIDQ